jgi:hypothetical protein
MKAWALIASFVFLLGSFTFSFAQQERFDITLEGPWILYVDNTFTKWPVLVAIAPNTQSVANWAHDPILVSSGDGYFLYDYTKGQGQQANFYCLMLDDVCAPQGTTSLKFHDYPDAVGLLSVHKPVGQTNWKWSDAVQRQNATAVILPMPDSYSSDGVWPMRFAAKFDLNHVGYGANEVHPIGVQLHYTGGPETFDLDSCPSGALQNCSPVVNGSPTVQGHTYLPNTGTLRITMRAPHTESACDPHVRRIFPKMLDIVGQPANSNRSVIDPAHRVKDDGSGSYDEDFASEGYTESNGTPYSCLRRDGQNPACDANGQHCDDDLPFKETSFQSYDPWLEALGDLQTAIKGLPKDQQSENLKKLASENLAFPRLSQINTIQVLIGTLDHQLEVNNAAKEYSRPIQHIGGHPKVAAGKESTLTVVKGFLAQLYNNPPTKSGADCKAAVMLVK